MSALCGDNRLRFKGVLEEQLERNYLLALG